MRPPFVFTSRYEALDARYQRVLAERNDAREERDAERSAKQIAARRVGLLSERVEERDARILDLTARLAEHDVPADVAALKQRLADAEASARQLQERLDQALGLDDPAVAAGAGWQSRRQHKLPLDPS